MVELQQRQQHCWGSPLPSKLAGSAALHRKVCAQQVHHVCLLAEVDADQVLPCSRAPFQCSPCSHSTHWFSSSGAALQQTPLLMAHSSCRLVAVRGNTAKL